MVDGPRYLQVRCGRRDCPYCGWLRGLEDATALFLDAREQQPRVAITLTTTVPWEQLDPEVYRRASEAVLRALRRRYERVEWVGCIEFTTGEAATSGGHRRMHGHYLVKGIPPEHVLEVEKLIRRIWEKRTGAYVVEVAELRSAGGAIAYVGLHHRKPQQRPPEGWRGMTLRATQGYWHRPIAELREQARLELRRRTIRWKLERAGMDPTAAALFAEAELDAQQRAIETNGARLVKVREGIVIEPLGPVDPPCDMGPKPAPVSAAERLLPAGLPSALTLTVRGDEHRVDASQEPPAQERSRAAPGRSPGGPAGL